MFPLATALFVVAWIFSGFAETEKGHFLLFHLRYPPRGFSVFYGNFSARHVL